MGWLDRFTGKDKINNLLEFAEGQRRALQEEQEALRESRQALSVMGNMVYDLTGRLRNLEEKEQWNLISGTDSKRELDDTTRNALRERCIDIYYKTPEGRAIIDRMVDFIIGQGVHWTAQDENPQVQEFIDKVCDSPGIRFSQRQFSIIRRVLRDGEVFIHLISDPQGFTHSIRFYPPAEISGVQNDPQDSEKVISYEREYGDENGRTQKETIKAEEIVHIRLAVDEDIQRGRPLLEPVIKRIVQYEEWLNNRVVINKTKSSIVLEKIVKGSPSRVSGAAATLPGTSSGTFSQDEYAVQAPRPGTVVVHNEAVEYKWNAPDIKADDVAEDGRQIRLSIAAGVGMPEYVLTSDASNQNYASSMVAESPFVIAVKGYQGFFEGQFKTLFGRIIQRGIAGGSIPQTSIETVPTEEARKRTYLLRAMMEAAISDEQREGFKEQIAAIVKDETQYEEKIVPTSTEVDFEWPTIAARNLWEETQAVDMHFNNGWVSKRTVRMRFGYDPDEEERLIEKEKEESRPEEAAYKQMQDEIAALKGKIGAGTTGTPPENQ